MDVDGEVVLVTGGAGGLGTAYCRLLAARGARVVVNDTGGVVDGRGGDPDVAQRLVDEIVQAGGEAVADVHDGSTVKGAQAAVAMAVERFGRLDAVVSNAGILRDRTFLKVSDEDFFAVVDAHLGGTVRICHAALPVMKEQGYGRLVLTTSASGLFGNFGQTSYAAAKLGIVGFAQSLSLEVGKIGVLVNVIAPSARTRMTAGLDVAPDDGRMAPELVAPLVAHLASRECGVTGRIYSVGLGRLARADVGVTRGLTNRDMTPEWVAENLAVVDKEPEYVFPETAMDEMRLWT